MRDARRASWPLAAVPLLLVGCAQNPYVLQGQLQTLQQQHLAMTGRYQELEERARSLDDDNQELQTLLGQAQRQNRVQGEEIAALRDQLGSVTEQLASLGRENARFESKAETMAASLKRRAEASIRPNSSLRSTLPAINLPGVEVRADGDVIRIELPGEKLFASGSDRLLPDAGRVIDAVAAEIERSYARQTIGVEGHTDSDPIRTGRFGSNQQLSVSRAMAVYDYLVNRSRISPNQLFVVGHGANHPVVSNATEAGKERNRRVELVIYPEPAS